MKKCHGCDRDLESSAFGVCRQREDGLQAQCRDCMRAHNKRWYRENKAKVRKRARDRRQEIREYLWNIKLQGKCVDCGEADPRVLEFDHVRGTKKFELSEAGRLILADGRIQEEVAKCDLRCANCHRRRTYNTNGGRSSTG